MTDSSTDPGQPAPAEATDEQALATLLAQERPRLRRMVQVRMDRRLQGRIDPSDVIQEAYLDAVRRLEEYRRSPGLPLSLWLRFLTGQKMAELHRRHLGVQARDAGREISLYQGVPAATSAALAARLIGGLTSPSQVVIKAEMRQRLEQALNQLDEIDREILTLRHLEQLNMAQAAQVLGIKHTAACNRYVRALKRLKDSLEGSQTAEVTDL